MKNINIGIANLIVSNKIKNSYFDQTYLSEAKEITTNFLDVINNSEILQLEFKVFDNIEKMYINSDVKAMRYIDNNIKLFEVFTLEEIAEEHKKLDKFLTESEIDNVFSDKVKLYNSIFTLIEQSLTRPDKIEVDILHESFDHVLEHIKKQKTVSKSIYESKYSADVINIAINKFNEKYSTLNENDKELLTKLINFSLEEKKDLLETFKNDSLSLLKELKDKNNVTEAIKKVNLMSFDSNEVNSQIINLFELKKGLL